MDLEAGDFGVVFYSESQLTYFVRPAHEQDAIVQQSEEMLLSEHDRLDISRGWILDFWRKLIVA